MFPATVLPLGATQSTPGRVVAHTIIRLTVRGTKVSDIPDWYRISGGQYNYSLTLQQATATADNAGDLMMQKGNPPASGSTTVLAPTKN